MKVYVCVCENDYDGRSVSGVFRSLDHAQEKMRVEYDGYLEQFAHKEHKPDIEWYPGERGQWGWYDVNESNGFYIYEMELE